MSWPECVFYSVLVIVSAPVVKTLIKGVLEFFQDVEITAEINPEDKKDGKG